MANSNMPSAADLAASAVKPGKCSGSTAIAEETPIRSRGTKRPATAAVVEQHEPEAVAEPVATLAPVAAAEPACAKTVVGVATEHCAAVPPVSPELAALQDEINTLACDLRRLAKAATRTAVQLGERLNDLFDHASEGAWDALVRRTGVNICDAASLVAFAEGRHSLVERLSPVCDVPLREVLTHVTALANTLTLTASIQQPTNTDLGAEKEKSIRVRDK
jgi:hypothetical protein